MDCMRQDDLAVLSDDELEQKESALKRLIIDAKRQSARSTGFEIDLCYVQRELDARAARKTYAEQMTWAESA